MDCYGDMAGRGAGSMTQEDAEQFGLDVDNALSEWPVIEDEPETQQ